ncbi:hypothetical protein CYY_000906 [Polysphondylium violaceum]|uniref:Peptidase S28 family protein n=1 Tax=Polysphondylium violaceum TaxID=133409 RepID=A0A8J4Q301_9MYCE|nr:hypothetical protein CYY_000906 [Polysphondylium violaceum]
MTSNTIIVAILISFLVSKSNSALWFEQAYDHFNSSSNTTFQQRYFINDTHFKPGGPVFYLIGLELPLDEDYVSGKKLIVNEYAERYNGYIVALEHRFFGESVPFNHLSLENLEHLNTKQALADFANFKVYFDKQYNTTGSKWISFGLSYSGNLSAWLRLKYPHLIDAAIASSAPLQQVDQYPEHFEIVGQVLGKKCARIISNLTRSMETMLETKEGCHKIKQIYKTCDPIESEEDKTAFLYSLSYPVQQIVQYNNVPNGFSAVNVNSLCKVLKAGKNDPISSFAFINSGYNQLLGNNCTISNHNSYVKQLKIETVENRGFWPTLRAGYYLQCLEMGTFTTGESKNQPFSRKISLKYFIKRCKDIFGENGYRVPNTEEYGSKDIESTNILFTNGLADPYHKLGLLSTNNPKIEVFILNNTGHCADIYKDHENDNPELVSAHKVQFEFISKILNK